MRGLKELNVKKKRVIVRVDFNVSVGENNEVIDDLRIRESIPTINHLTEKGAKVILISHFKEPKEKSSLSSGKKGKIEKNRSLRVVAAKLSEVLGKEVKFCEDSVGEGAEEVVKKLEEGEVLLLENLRVYREEKEKSEDFARKLASLGDIYINDAFSVSHRDHSSISLLPKLLPAGYGMLIEKEMRVLDKIKRDPQRPVVAIIGGAKVKSKISTVSYFVENADHVLLGGKIANTLLIVRQLAHNKPLPEKEIVDAVKDMDYTTPRLHLPVDVVASTGVSDKKVRETAVGNVREGEDIFDLGSETTRLYGEVIREAGTVIWAGPLGLSEEKLFEKGTREVGEHISKNKEALKVAGGGDTNKALKQFGLREEMDHISCGGGAMLTYIMGGFMPGIEALKK